LGAIARRITRDILATTMMVTAVAMAPTGGAVAIAATLAVAATTDAVAMAGAAAMAAMAGKMTAATERGRLTPSPTAGSRGSDPRPLGPTVGGRPDRTCGERPRASRVATRPRSDQPIARRTYRLYTALKSRRCDDRSLLLRPRRGYPRLSIKLKGLPCLVRSRR